MGENKTIRRARMNERYKQLTQIESEPTISWEKLSKVITTRIPLESNR